MIEEETDFLHHLLGHLAQRGSSLEPEPPWFPTSVDEFQALAMRLAASVYIQCLQYLRCIILWPYCKLE